MSDLKIDFLCFLYVAAEVFAGFLLGRYAGWKSEYVRKFIHILTSFIIIPAELYIKNPVYRLLVPFLFILINSFAVLTGLTGTLGLGRKGRKAGLVIYPVSVTVLVLLEICGVISPSSAICGTLIMGLGDGMAAVAGKLLGKHGYRVYGRYDKSLEGSLAMAFFTAAVLLTFTRMSILRALAVSLLVTLIENFSPSCVDNISVPVLSALLAELFSRL